MEGEQEEGFEEESEEGLEHDIEGEEVEELMKHGGVESWEDLESDLEQKVRGHWKIKLVHGE